MKISYINAVAIENLSNGKFVSMSGQERGQFFSQNVKPVLALAGAKCAATLPCFEGFLAMERRRE